MWKDNNATISVMDIYIFLWAAPVIVGLLLLVVFARFNNQYIAQAALGAVIASIPFSFVVTESIVAKIIMFLLSAWLVVLPGRILFGRQNREFLLSSTLKDALVGLAVVVFLALYILIFEHYFDYEHYALYFALVSITAGALIFTQLVWSVRHYSIPEKRHIMSKLPTISLCIAARDEDYALETCLKKAIASDYPKLEILVYDDNSRDNTSQVIRDFAMNGVIFVQGEMPASGWLGKNQAMHKLAQQAVGDYVVFMSVDTHLDTSSLSQLIEYAIAGKYSMISVLPKNRSLLIRENIFDTLKYFWRVALPISDKHVPTSSKLWLIASKTLKELGGFDAARSKALPEAYFARTLFKVRQYRFLVSSIGLGITTAKKWSSQIESSVRTIYPVCRRRPSYVLAMCVSMFAVFMLPGVFVAVDLITGNVQPATWFNVAAIGLAVLNYGIYLFASRVSYRVASLVMLPYSLVQEIVISVISMLKYEFGAVNWKGRNVGFPAGFYEQLKEHNL